MFHKIFHNILLRRHFWRHATLSEVSELYASRMLRMAAMHLAGSFTSVYLYQIGYSVAFIVFMWAAFFATKMLIMLPVAAIVARIGPKHAILVSNILYIPAMIGFVLVPSMGPLILIPALLFEAFSVALYAIGYGVDFSKVKSADHAGKEIAYMNIVEKITTGLAPLIGGFIAFIFGPQVVIVLSAILFLLAAAPLFKTGEPVQTHQRLQLRGFPWRIVGRHAIAEVTLGFDIISSGTIWMLYFSILIIGISDSNHVYIAAGVILSVVLLAAIAASYVFGKLIDSKQGYNLYRFSVIAKSLVHLTRPFITTPVAAAALNATSEVSTTGYHLPYTRAVFDNADASGARVTYIGIIEMLANFGAALAVTIVGILCLTFGETAGLTNFFFISAAVALLFLTARFPLFKK